MISASSAFMAKVNNGETPYVRMQLTTAAGRSIWIEDGQFWGDSISFQEAVSSEGSFDFGGAVIGAFNFSLNNFDRSFDSVDFAGAVVIPFVYYTISGTREYLPKGVYYISSHRTSGNIIQCTAMDALKLMDNSQTAITYPITVQDLVEALCTANGITLATETIHNGTFQITQAPPSSLVLTDRQMLSYACQMTGNYAKMNEEGELVVGWFDFDNPVSVGSTFNGKSLWTAPISVTGLKVSVGSPTGVLMAVTIDGNGQLQYVRAADISDTFSINSNGELVAVSVSGATYTITNGALMRTGEALTPSGDEDHVNVLFGTDDYVVTIENNPYITVANVALVCQMVSERIFGIPIRPGTIPILSNPCLQAGDVLEITDYITHLVYQFPVTSLVYNKMVTETVNCAFESKDDVDLRLSSDYSIKVSVSQAMQQALAADALAQAAQEAAEVSGYELLIVSDKGLAINTDGVVNLSALIYDREMLEIDQNGTGFIYRWWVMQDSKSATYLNGGKVISVLVDDALCDYAAGIYYEIVDVSEGINPFSLSNRSGLVLTDRAGLPLTARAAESVPT